MLSRIQAEQDRTGEIRDRSTAIQSAISQSANSIAQILNRISRTLNAICRIQDSSPEFKLVLAEINKVRAEVAAYGESVAGRDDTLITSVGMELKSSPSTTTLPSVPQALTAAAGDHDGELFLSWKSVPYAKSHVIESSTDPATGDELAVVPLNSSKRRHFATRTYGTYVGR